MGPGRRVGVDRWTRIARRAEMRPGRPLLIVVPGEGTGNDRGSADLHLVASPVKDLPAVAS